MATFGSLRTLFEKPLPENPTLMESLSWNQIKAVKPPDDSAFTEIFGELHFEERRPADDPPRSSSAPTGLASPSRPLPSAPSWSPALDGRKENVGKNREDPSMGSPLCAAGEHSGDAGSEPRSSGEGFPSLDSLLGVTSNHYASSDGGRGVYSPKGHAESLQLCTEGLGFESCDDVEDSRSESGKEWGWRRMETTAVGGAPSDGWNGCARTWSERRPRTSGDFPPPISCIGSRGKPWVRLRSYRQDGRFVLREVRSPTEEVLRACRKDGRLKLQFVQPDDDMTEEEEEEEKEEEQEGGEEEEDKDHNEDQAGGVEEEEGKQEDTEEQKKKESGGMD